MVPTAMKLWRINSSGIAEMVEDTVAGGGINPAQVVRYRNI